MLHVMWISSNPDHRLAAAVRPHERDVILDAPHLRCRHRHVRARAWGQVLHLGGYDLGRERYDEVRGARCEVREARLCELMCRTAPLSGASPPEARLARNSCE